MTKLKWNKKSSKLKQNPLWFLSVAFQFCTRGMFSDSHPAALSVLRTISSQWEANHIIHLHKCTAQCRGGPVHSLAEWVSGSADIRRTAPLVFHLRWRALAGGWIFMIVALKQYTITSTDWKIGDGLLLPQHDD